MKKVVFALPDAARVVSGTFEEQGDFRVLDGEVFHKDQLLMRSSEGHAVVRGGIAAQFDCDEVVFNAERGMWKLVTTEGETVMIKQATGVVVTVTEDEGEGEAEEAPAPRRGAKKPAGKPARGSRRQPAADPDDSDYEDPDADDGDADEGDDEGDGDYEEEAPAPRRGAKKPAGKTATKPARGSRRQPAADPDDGDADEGDDEGDGDYEDEAPAPRRGAKKPAGKTARASADVDTDAFDWDD